MPQQKLSVLWVDDDANTPKHSSTRQLLKQAFRLEALDSTGQLESMLKKESFHVVLLDVVFGDKRTAGIDALKWIRRAHPRQRVLVYTGTSYGPDLDRIQAICEESDGQVMLHEKPRRALDIIEDIKSWMRSHPTEGTK